MRPMGSSSIRALPHKASKSAPAITVNSTVWRAQLLRLNALGQSGPHGPQTDHNEFLRERFLFAQTRPRQNHPTGSS